MNTCVFLFYSVLFCTSECNSNVLQVLHVIIIIRISKIDVQHELNFKGKEMSMRKACGRKKKFTCVENNRINSFYSKHQKFLRKIEIGYEKKKFLILLVAAVGKIVSSKIRNLISDASLKVM